MNRRRFITTLGSVATLHTLRGRSNFSFASVSPSLRGAVTTTRYPYIQNVGNDRASILWATMEPGTGAVEYSPDGTNWGRVTAAKRTFTASETGSAADLVQYEAVITGLQPSTDYVYRVTVDGADVGAGGETRFRTAGPGPFSFVVVGDSGYGSDEQNAIAQRVLAEKPAFVIHTGDLVYNPDGAPGTSIDLYQRNYFDYYYGTMSSAPFFPTPGNHDFGPGLIPYLTVHSFPGDTTPSADRGRYYSYDWGNVHFVSLDAHAALGDAVYSGGRMLDWLDNDLQSTRQFWRVVYFHYPPFAAGPNMNEPRSALVRQYVVPILEKYGVQIVFSGHEHSYQRSQPLRNSSFVTPHTGTTYVLSGGGGSMLYPVFDGYPIVSFGQSAHHYVRAEIRGTQFTLRAIRHDGVELDNYTIAPVPVLSDDPAVQPMTVSGEPGSGPILNIAGRNLAAEETFSASSAGAGAIGGTAVTINGAPIPLNYVSPHQIYGRLPGRIDGNVTVRVTTANGFFETSL